MNDKASDGTGGIVENTICEDAEEEVVFAPREKREESVRTKPNRYAT